MQGKAGLHGEDGRAWEAHWNKFGAPFEGMASGGEKSSYANDFAPGN
jgi:hypothetical protein